MRCGTLLRLTRKRGGESRLELVHGKAFCVVYSHHSNFRCHDGVYHGPGVTRSNRLKRQAPTKMISVNISPGSRWNPPSVLKRSKRADSPQS
eukprot:690466-Amphidinium_carterae.1